VIEIMNCRRFERDLPDWAAGRLPSVASDQMSAHSTACESCARMADAERSLRSAWRELPSLGETPDIWPQLAARISTSTEPRAARHARSPWLAWLPAAGPSLRYGLAGVGAALIVGALIVSRPINPTEPTGVGPQPPITANESRVIDLVSSRQAMLPEGDGDFKIMAASSYRTAERVVLGVGTER
jgi:hypothetical protein